MNMTNDETLVETEFGWAVQSDTPPKRKDMNWLKTPENHIYYFDGDGWYRLKPPETAFLPDRELPHG